jgi:hypothetical protein
MKDLISVAFVCNSYSLYIENVIYSQVSQAPATGLYVSEPIILQAWFNIVSLLCLYSYGCNLYGCAIYLHLSDLASG